MGRCNLTDVLAYLPPESENLLSKSTPPFSAGVPRLLVVGFSKIPGQRVIP